MKFQSTGVSAPVAPSEAAQRALVKFYRGLPVMKRAEFVECMHLLNAEFVSAIKRAELRDRIGEQVGHA